MNKICLFLPIAFLLFSCSKKNAAETAPQNISQTMSANTESAEDLAETESEKAGISVENQPQGSGNSPDQELPLIEPGSPFPVDTWLVAQDIGTPVIPFHPVMGALRGLEASSDETNLYTLSERFLNNSAQRKSYIYPPLQNVLYKKSITLLREQDFLIGNPVVKGSTAEVAFFLADDKRKGYLYWLFEERWMLEDFDLQ